MKSGMIKKQQCTVTKTKLMICDCVQDLGKTNSIYW